jgi:hypothetical protein
MTIIFIIILILSAVLILAIVWIVRLNKTGNADKNQYLNYIRENNGSFYLNDFSARFRLSRNNALAVMKKLINDFQGCQYPVSENNNVLYDFPTFMGDMPKATTTNMYPEFIEQMISNYSKKIDLPNHTARFYFVQICTLAAHLQGRLSIHTLKQKIDEGSFELDRSHFSPYKTTWDIVSILMAKMIDVRFVSILNDETPSVLKFHEDLCKHFR